MNRREALHLMGAAMSALTLPRPLLAAPRARPATTAPSRAFRECLVDVYAGEVLGESLFGEMLDGTETPDERYVLGSMLQLETEGKAMLRPLLARLGLTLREDGASRAQGATSAAKLNRLSWTERFQQIGEAIETKFLPRYQALVSLVSREDDPEAARIASFMGRHECALLAASKAVASGAAAPVAPVVRVLRLPLARS
jgi:hypothetical protein